MLIISHKKQEGFSLAVAIYLLVVMGLLQTLLVYVYVGQQQQTSVDLLDSRAYLAARSGVEWGAYELLRTGGVYASACAAGPITDTLSLSGALTNFAVTVSCESTAQNEIASGGVVTSYRLVSTASGPAGEAVGQPGYVEKQIEITLTP